MAIRKLLGFLLGLTILVSSCEDDNMMPQNLLPTLSISSPTILEGDNGNNSLLFEVSLNGEYSSENPVAVDYKTLDGSAIAGLDFAASSGTVTFNKPESKKNISIEIITDELKEGDEVFTVQLLNVSSNAEIFGQDGTGTIRNDDNTIMYAADGYLSPETYEGFGLSWNDEFEGSEISSTDWTFEIGDGCPDLCGWGNNELEYYSDRLENVVLEDGKLLINALNDPFSGHTYTSGRITTKDKRDFKYGRIDVRAKLPKGRGMWPAIWMLGSNIDEVSWPQCGEIDIMELVGHEPSSVHGTAHFGQSFPNNSFIGTSYSLEAGEDFSERFHVFSIMWIENAIYWFVDDIVFYSVTLSDMNSEFYPFNNDFFFTINLAIGGNWPGDPDATTVFPQQMAVDYIRVFQKG